MSFPQWPQSKYVYRPRMNNMVPTSYGGFGAVPQQPGGVIGGHYYPSQVRYGSLSPDDWATPSYIRTDEGLGTEFVLGTLIAADPATVPAGSLGTGKCFEVVWSRIHELVDYASSRTTPVFRTLVKLLFNALVKKLDKAIFSKIWTAYQQGGGKTGARAFIVSNTVNGLALFPSDLLQQLSNLGGSELIDALADYGADWLDARIKECAGTATTTTTTTTTGGTATDANAILMCSANGIPLVQCPLPSLGGKSPAQKSAEQAQTQVQNQQRLVSVSPVLVANPSAVSAAVLADQKVAAALKQQQQQQQQSGSMALPLVAGAAAIALLFLRR